MLVLVACSALLAVGLDAPPTSDANQSYQEAKAKAGRSPEEQVRLALWCEAHGLTTQRLHHLTLAILADPKNLTARGLMGLVLHEGRWLRPEVLADKLKADPEKAATLAEYQSRRLKADYKADAQYALGIWCDEHGLKEQARAHLTAVTRLDPKRDNAWKKLGYAKHEGRWVTEAQLAAEKTELEAQKQADKTWRPLLDRYKSMLDRPANRAEAEAALAEITDPRAVPAIMHAFGHGKGRPVDQLRAVQLLGQVDSPMASRSLAGLAVLSKSPEVRRVAVETLKTRDPRDFVRLWIALIRKPIKYEIKPVGGPGSPGELLVEGERANLKRLYSPPAMPNVPIAPGTRVSYDNNGLPVLTEPMGVDRNAGRVVWLPYYSLDTPQLVGAVGQAIHGGNFQQALSNQQTQTGRPIQTIAGYAPYALINGELVPIDAYSGSGNTIRIEQEKRLQIPLGQMAVETEKSARSAQQQLAGDVAELEKVNAAVRRLNEPTLQALRAVTGQSHGDDPIAWSQWWTDQEGYVFAITQTTGNPTFIENVPLNYTPQAVPQIVGGTVTVARSHSCFAAGTTVRTIDGDRLIESIQPGDLVLVQDTKSGALGYQGVVAAYHNPPNATLRVNLGGDESVVATGIHRFWKAGKGWTMARDLKAGDLVRNLGGVAKVESVEEDKVQPVFNLEVAEGHSFLVGKLGTLVHDNSLVETVPTPFDAGTTPVQAVAKVAK
jgi:Pretoxin HINT domain